MLLHHHLSTTSQKFLSTKSTQFVLFLALSLLNEIFRTFYHNSGWILFKNWSKKDLSHQQSPLFDTQYTNKRHLYEQKKLLCNNNYKPPQTMVTYASEYPPISFKCTNESTNKHTSVEIFVCTRLSMLASKLAREKVNFDVTIFAQWIHFSCCYNALWGRKICSRWVKDSFVFSCVSKKPWFVDFFQQFLTGLVLLWNWLHTFGLIKRFFSQTLL